VLRRTPPGDAIDLLGRGRIEAVAAGGGEVYVETLRVIGPQRFDPRLGVGQPDSEYGIAVFDVAAISAGPGPRRPVIGVASIACSVRVHRVAPPQIKHGPAAFLRIALRAASSRLP
jgi:hypothetical protein